MTHRPNRPEDRFDTWLDAYVTGMSTPASRAASDPETGDVRDTARQFHGLARGAERSPTVTPFTSIWEDFMSAQSIGTAADLFNSAAPREHTPMRRPLVSARSWERPFNVALAAALVLVLSAGIWRASGGTMFGSGDDGPPDSPGIPFGGQVAEDDSDNIDLPTADDCTVEPLTVDEVIWYIQDPYEASYSTDMASPGPMPTEFVSATPPATNPPNYEPRPATQEELEGAAETHRMLMACTLADSYFQIWALFEPFEVREHITAVLPPLTGEDEARAILEELESTGTAGEGPVHTFYPPSELGFLGIIPDGGAQLLDTDPSNSWSEAEGQITAGYTTYNADGAMLETTNALADRLGTPVDPDRVLLTGGSSCSNYQFAWNEARAMWLVRSAPQCG